MNKNNIPLWLNAEITYKCPLHCVFCYNPTNYKSFGEELSTEEWIKVFSEARKMGAVQLGISGGEPLMRDDVEAMVDKATNMGFYVNLITSGIGLTEKRIKAFKKSGLGQIQLSFQDSTKELNDFLSSTRTFDLKSKVAKLIKKYDYPMVLNVVLHRLNIDHIEEILKMAESMGAEHVELANTQFYAWAYENKKHLIPTKKQIVYAEKITNDFRKKVNNKMKLYFVHPDYYEKRPKACMNGWGTTFLNVAADGLALPCHEARIIKNLSFPNVKNHSIDWIWNKSKAFNAYRGYDWMKEPCKSCPEKSIDFGGCRCQAFMLSGDATNTDPVCDKSEFHVKIEKDVEEAQKINPIPQEVKSIILFRNDENSKKISKLDLKK